MQQKSRSSFWIYIIIAIVLAWVITCLVFIFTPGFNFFNRETAVASVSTAPAITPSYTIIPVSTPTPSPTPSLPEGMTCAYDTGIPAGTVVKLGDTEITLEEIPAYSESSCYIINNNTPYFTEDELTTEPFETYSELDALGRCGTAYINACTKLMPTEDRGDISSVTPSGWEYNGDNNNQYYDHIEGGYLYNRCHLIMYALSGENDNERNLVTGTRYLNIEGMLPFEEMVHDYLTEHEKTHVLYRVTPVFLGDELVCRGVLMEAMSVEDTGEAILYCVFCYNVQPGCAINYTTGENCLDTDHPVVEG